MELSLGLSHSSPCFYLFNLEMAYCHRGRNFLATVFEKGSPGYHRCFCRLRLDASVSVVGRSHQGHHKDLTQNENRA